MKHLLLTTIAAVLVVGCGTSIHDAASDRSIEAVKQHLAAGADVNAMDGDGDTPLHLAGNTTASTEIAELLISKGADVNAMNLSPPGRRIGGMTPLDMATLGNRTEIAALLRKHGGKTAKELGVSYLTTDSILRKDGKTGEELKAEGIDNTDHQNKTE